MVKAFKDREFTCKKCGCTSGLQPYLENPDATIITYCMGMFTEQRQEAVDTATLDSVDDYILVTCPVCHFKWSEECVDHE